MGEMIYRVVMADCLIRWVSSEIGSELPLWCTENVAQEAVGYLYQCQLGFLFSPAVI